MPSKPGDVHVNAPLTNFALQLRNRAFVAEDVFPVLTVMKESDVYYTFSREELRDVDTLRAVSARAKEVEWVPSTASYTAEEYALRHLLADRIVNNADAPVRPRMNTVSKLMKWIQLGQEKRVQAICQNGANVVATVAVAPKWDGTSPTIERDIDTAKDSVRNNAGVEPNAILLPENVKDVVKRDSTLRDLIRYVINLGAGNRDLLMNGELPPVMFNLAIIIAGATEDTGKLGASSTIAKIWNDAVPVFYREAAPSLEAVTWGMIMRVQSPIVKTYRDEHRAGEYIECSVIQAEELVTSNAANLLTDVLS
jgi:hypothetical protein